jgi:heme exporter protein A
MRHGAKNTKEWAATHSSHTARNVTAEKVYHSEIKKASTNRPLGRHRTSVSKHALWYNLSRYIVRNKGNCGASNLVNHTDTNTDGANIVRGCSDGQNDGIQVVFEGVGHRFGTRLVLENVNFRIGAGEVGVVTGANGSGKSTLLKIAAGLLTPHAGNAHIELDGELVDDSARRSCVGYLSPDLTLYRELTGAENLAFFAELRGLRPTRDMLVQALTEVGLRGRGRDLVSGYSSGMRQRLKYAFALLGRPPILILDEPTANLDSEGVTIVQSIVTQQRERPDGGLVIVATNEPGEAAWGESLVELGQLG